MLKRKIFYIYYNSKKLYIKKLKDIKEMMSEKQDFQFKRYQVLEYGKEYIDE